VDQYLTSMDMRLFEMIKYPVGGFLVLSCIFLIFLNIVWRKSGQADALYLVFFYNQLGNLGKSFMLGFSWWVVCIQFLLKWIFSGFQKNPKELFLDVSVEYGAWIAEDR